MRLDYVVMYYGDGPFLAVFNYPPLNRVSIYCYPRLEGIYKNQYAVGVWKPKKIKL
jgi:hypothetical protein